MLSEMHRNFDLVGYSVGSVSLYCSVIYACGPVILLSIYAVQS